MKTCNECKEPKPTSDFYRNAKTKDGLMNPCKACRKRDRHIVGLQRK